MSSSFTPASDRQLASAMQPLHGAALAARLFSTENLRHARRSGTTRAVAQCAVGLDPACLVAGRSLAVRSGHPADAHGADDRTTSMAQDRTLRWKPSPRRDRERPRVLHAWRGRPALKADVRLLAGERTHGRRPRQFDAKHFLGSLRWLRLAAEQRRSPASEVRNAPISVASTRSGGACVEQDETPDPSACRPSWFEGWGP